MTIQLHALTAILTNFARVPMMGAVLLRARKSSTAESLSQPECDVWAVEGTVRRFGVYMLVCAGLLTHSPARGGTVDTFTLKNTGKVTANDITVAFKQDISKVGPNQILEKNGTDSGETWTYNMMKSSRTSLIFQEPDGQKPFGDVLPGESFKLKVTTNANTLKLDLANTFFTEDGARIQKSVTQVGANLNFNQDPNTGTAVVSTSNVTGDYVFLHDIEIWTGLTYAQVTNWNSSGELDTSGLGSPNLTPSDLVINPDSAGSSIPLGLLPENGSYALVYYDMLSGPTSSIGSATDYGQTEFAASSIPEPTGLVLLATGCACLVAYRCSTRASQRKRVGRKAAVEQLSHHPAEVVAVAQRS